MTGLRLTDPVLAQRKHSAPVGYVPLPLLSLSVAPSHRIMSCLLAPTPIQGRGQAQRKSWVPRSRTNGEKVAVTVRKLPPLWTSGSQGVVRGPL